MTYNPLTILRRRARAKGFGVHSPFAYRFITEVLSEHLCYYDYNKLETKTDRTLYRIAAYFSPAKIYTSLSRHARTILMACPHSRYSNPEECDLAVFTSNDEIESMLCAIDRQSRIILIDEARLALPEVKKHLDSLQCGMLFDNASDLCVIVPSRKLPRQNFELKF